MARTITLEAARAAKSEALRSLADVPEVNGIGLCRRGNGYALKVNLEREPSVEVPDKIRGVELVVEVVGKIRKLDGGPSEVVYRVVHEGDGWVVRRDGARRRSSVHDTQRDAVRSARRLARSASGVLVIHGRDGTPRRRTAYSDES